MASKDQAIGALIFIVCIVIGIGYLVVVAAPYVVSPIIGVASESLRFWAVAVVVLIAFLAIMFIGAWIGWTMATTPPPKPIEDLELEEEKAEEKTTETKVEEKREPAKQPETEAKVQTEPTTEPKPDKPKRQRKKTNP